MEADAIIETAGIHRPFEWLDINAWSYLADYIDDYDYAYYDELYRVLVKEKSLEDFNDEWSQRFEKIRTIEDAWKEYNDNFPKLMAQAMKDIADDILEGKIIVKFTDCD